jgi:hypothetical protein
VIPDLICTFPAVVRHLPADLLKPPKVEFFGFSPDAEDKNPITQTFWYHGTHLWQPFFASIKIDE